MSLKLCAQSSLDRENMEVDVELRTTSVSKRLDKKLIIFGFEVPDLVAIFIMLSILNFLFRQTSFKLLMVWLPTSALALALYFGKKGKPDNHLVHWLTFQI